MIKHEEVRAIIQKNKKSLSNKNICYYFTKDEFNKLDNYITEQEKKDELLGLYKSLHNAYRYPTWNLEEEVKRVLKEIKALEEELK